MNERAEREPSPAAERPSGQLPTELSLRPPEDTDLIPRTHSLPPVEPSGALGVGEISLAQGGRIEGRVFSSRGEPLVGVAVRLQAGGLWEDRLTGGVGLRFSLSHGDELSDWDADFTRGSDLDFGAPSWRGFPVKSREDGRYAIRSVPRGRHTLVAVQGERSLARRDGIAVRAGQVRGGVDFVLAPGPVLEVEVRDTQGVAVAGASISASDDEGFSQVLVTDAGGLAVAAQPSPGRFDVELKPLSALSRRNQSATLDEQGATVFEGVRPGLYRVSLLDGAPASAEVEVTSAGARVLLSRN